MFSVFLAAVGLRDVDPVWRELNSIKFMYSESINLPLMTIKYWNVEVSLSFVTTTNLKYFIRPSKSCCKSSLRATLRMAKATRNMVSMPCKRKTSRTRKTCCWRNQKVFILQDKIYANFTEGGCYLSIVTGVTFKLASDYSKTKRKWHKPNQ